MQYNISDFLKISYIFSLSNKINFYPHTFIFRGPCISILLFYQIKKKVIYNEAKFCIIAGNEHEQLGLY